MLFSVASSSRVLGGEIEPVVQTFFNTYESGDGEGP